MFFVLFHFHNGYLIASQNTNVVSMFLKPPCPHHPFQRGVSRQKIFHCRTKQNEARIQFNRQEKVRTSQLYCWCSQNSPGFSLSPLLHISAILYIMPEKGVNSNTKCPIFRISVILICCAEKSLDIARCSALSLCCLQV